MVTYEPDELLAVGYNDGVKVIEDKRMTTGKPYALVLKQENHNVEANGQDIVLLTCKDVERVYIGKKVDDSEKKRESERVPNFVLSHKNIFLFYFHCLDIPRKKLRCLALVDIDVETWGIEVEDEDWYFLEIIKLYLKV